MMEQSFKFVDFERNWTLKYQGAESRLYFGKLDGVDCIAKHRFSKKYRNQILDKRITKERTRREIRIYERISKKSDVLAKYIPSIKWSNESTIIMTQLTGYSTIHDYLESNSFHETSPQVENLVGLIGSCIAHLHNLGVIHGDLTTSNLLIRQHQDHTSLISSVDGVSVMNEQIDNGKKGIPSLPDHVVPIDFGLSSFSVNAEDRAVDLYVLERALITTHYPNSKVFDKIFKRYMTEIDPSTCGPPPGVQRIINKLQDVKQRGRKQ